MEFHGLIGQARHYDVLVKQTSKPALSALLRIVHDDLGVFTTSLAGFSFRLGEFLGREYDASATISITQHAPHLSLLADQLLVNVL